ncbi:hypothetical protein J6590_013893 [Homalodisca vitripennis]|nr:hypothetical protein J6590_013893 [Homalodisca vitripennis]
MAELAKQDLTATSKLYQCYFNLQHAVSKVSYVSQLSRTVLVVRPCHSPIYLRAELSAPGPFSAPYSLVYKPFDKISYVWCLAYSSKIQGTLYRDLTDL